MADPFPALDTAQLRRIRDDLAQHIPGDPTWTAAAGTLLRSLLDLTLSDPDRAKRDQEAAQAQQQASQQAAADALAQKQEAEKAAAVSDAHAAEIAAKHQAELDALADQQVLADLDRQQAQERADFEKHLTEERADVLARRHPASGGIPQSGPVDETYPGFVPGPAPVPFGQPASP